MQIQGSVDGVYVKSVPHHVFSLIIEQLGLRLGLGLVLVLMTANGLCLRMSASLSE